MLALLVVVSLILLTAYFGESPQSPLHSVQRGIVQVFSPVQAGASKVLSPVRDVANWVSDTLRAKSNVDKLRKANRELTAQLATLKTAQLQNQQLTAEVGARPDDRRAQLPPGRRQRHRARPQPLVSSRSRSTPALTKGVEQGDPVLADGGLVGDVTTVDASVSIVTLITDASYAAAAQVTDNAGDQGILAPSVGNPNQLLLQDLPGRAQITQGDLVVTTGFKSGSLTSLYPPGLPIGTVGTVNPNQLFNNNEVPVSPTADLRHFSSVQILTRPHPANVRAQVP